MDKLKAMEAFVAAVDGGGYPYAAQKLAITPQMVAKHVKALEEHLGVRLLNRTTRKQSLTEFGFRYLDRCRHILAESESADLMAQEALSAPSGRLRVSGPTNFGAACFMRFVQMYLGRYPETQVELTLTDQHVNLTNEGYEVAFRIGGVDLEAGSLVRRELKMYHLVACASPAYLEKRGTPETPSDLFSHDCAAYLFADRVVGEKWVFRKDGESHEIRFKSRLAVNDTRALIAAGTLDCGIIIAPEDMVADEIKAGQLLRILSEYEGPSYPLSIVYRADRQQTASIKTFVGEASRYFADFPNISSRTSWLLHSQKQG